MVKLIFFGSPDFAVPSLQALAHDERFEVIAVVTQPDKPKGRGKKLQPTPIAEAAEQLNLPIIKSNGLKTDIVAIQQCNNADLMVVVAFGALLPPSVLSLPKYGTVNLHPSLLPKYRGASPIQAALLNGDRETGVSIMLLDEELDHGPLLWQEPVPIEHHDTAESLSARLSGVGANLLTTTIPLFIEGKITPQPQDHAQATFTKQLSKDDGKIDWTQSADAIARMIRAYYPWPGAWTTYRSTRRIETLKIIAAMPLHQAHPHPSGNVQKLEGNSYAVACGKNSLLKLITIQPAGKLPMPIEVFVRGHQSIVEEAFE